MKITNHNHITNNSKKVKQGSVFVSFNNNIENINEAIKNGTTLIVSKIKIDNNVMNIVVINIEYFYSYWYKKINNIDIEKFKVIGVTGTDGKTTTAKMIYDTITERYDAIYIGTLGIIYKDKQIETNNTTPDIEIILETFLMAKKENIKYIILEASSEGLLGKRLTGIKFDVVIFTNLSHEHLNTHKNMTEYFNSKKISLKLLKENGVVISNCEDEYGAKFKGNININYGLHKGKIKTTYFRLEYDYIKILIKYNNTFFYYKIPFVGVYNIYNFIAAFAAISHLLNIKLFSFNNLKKPEGRYTIVDNNIIIDYAHTPNALENLLLTIKYIYKNNKIILVMGSQGKKDKTKRRLLGMVADKYCDNIILTSEDPKDENLISIIFDISLGIINNIYTIEFSRKKAIDKAIDLKNENNVILIIGKGLETKENINNKIYSHSDYLCVLDKLKRLSNDSLENTSISNKF